MMLSAGAPLRRKSGRSSSPRGLADHHHVRDEDHRPDADDAEGGDLESDLEGVRRPLEVDDDADRTEGGRRQDGGVGNLGAAHLAEDARRRTGHGHRAQHAAGRVQARVHRRRDGRDEDDVHDVCHAHATDVEAHAVEHSDEGRLALLVLRGRQEEAQKRDGAHVEAEDAPQQMKSIVTC